jgi:hypothetical protein
VIGIYLEPFGIAAQIAATATGVPYYLMHAGSDITRLAQLPSRRSTYASAVARADRVLTSPSAAHAVMDLGTHPENLIVGRPVLAPPTLFRTAKPLDLSGLARDLGESSEYRYIGPTKTTSPLILIYGKLGQYKGTAELVAAAERLQDRGLDFCLLFVTGQGEPAFERLLKDVEDKGVYRNPLPATLESHRILSGFVRGCVSREQIPHHHPSTSDSP